MTRTAANLKTDGRTDRRTPYRFIDPRNCTAANLKQRVCCCRPMQEHTYIQTDGRTRYRFVDPRNSPMSVRLSVCLFQHGPTAANPLLQVCCCGPGGQEISTDCCSSGGGRMRAVPRCQRTYAAERRDSLLWFCSEVVSSRRYMSSSVLFGRNLDCVARRTMDDAGRVRRASLALLWMTIGAVVCTAHGKFSVRPLASAHGEGQMGSSGGLPIRQNRQLPKARHGAGARPVQRKARKMFY